MARTEVVPVCQMMLRGKDNNAAVGAIVEWMGIPLTKFMRVDKMENLRVWGRKRMYPDLYALTVERTGRCDITPDRWNTFRWLYLQMLFNTSDNVFVVSTKCRGHDRRIMYTSASDRAGHLDNIELFKQLGPILAEDRNVRILAVEKDRDRSTSCPFYQEFSVVMVAEY